MRGIERVFRWCVRGCVVLEAGVLTAVLAGVPLPPWSPAAIEVVLGLMLVTGVWLWWRAWRGARASGRRARAARDEAFEAVVPALVLKMVRMEFLLWRSLVLWIARRQDGVGPDASAFHYRGALMPLMAVFIGLSFVELLLFELLVPWETVRRVLLVVDAYGVVLSFAALAAISVRPHVLTPAGLRLRTGFGFEVTLCRRNIERARVQRRSHDGKSVLVEGGTLRFGAGGQTTVLVHLREPVELPLPGGRRGVVEAVRLHADDPERLVRCLQPIPESAQR